jgi:hypothetical protein
MAASALPSFLTGSASSGGAPILLAASRAIGSLVVVLEFNEPMSPAMLGNELSGIVIWGTDAVFTDLISLQVTCTGVSGNFVTVTITDNDTDPHSPPNALVLSAGSDVKGASGISAQAVTNFLVSVS